ARGVDLLELLDGLSLEGRVVHQQVDAAERAHRFVDYPAAVLFFGQIARHQDRAPPRRFDHALGLVRVVVLVQIGDHDVGAFARAARLPEGNFREAMGVTVASVGIGTYLGRDDDRTDAAYEEALRRALQLGINVVDSAINYRNQRSERAVGRALRAGTAPRERIVVCTKGGFLPFDAARPRDPRSFVEETYVRPGLLRWEDVVDGVHCLAPRFLADQIDRSRRNLGVATIDLYYLHNPETQLGEVARDE